MRLSSSVLVLSLVLAHASRSADAEPRRHEGLYLRLGLGAGYALGRLDATVDSDSRGVNVATELAIGTNLRPGLIVGVGTFPMVVPSPTYDGIAAGGQHVSGTGAFVDWYRRPGGGLHAQAGLLVAAGYLDGSAARPAATGVGYGAMAGIGFDRYVTARWSLGLLARVTAYRLYGVEDSLRLASPSLLVSATFD